MTRKTWIPLAAFIVVVVTIATILAVGSASASPDAECAKLLGAGQAQYRTCLAITRGNPNECASIQNVTERVQCRARASASANSR